MDLGLDGLTAVITGSSSGLGYAIAKSFISEGSNVVINGSNKMKLDQARNELNSTGINNLLAVDGDVTRRENCRKIIDAASEYFGSIDILVTNCGGPPPGTFETLNDDHWDQAINSSFKSHLYLIGESLPHLKKSEFPSVITITSFTVKQPMANLILSNTIRAATVALTKSLSLELGDLNIRFNSILPGWTLTSRVDKLLENRASINQSSYEHEKGKVITDIPLRRIADPKELANVVVFIASPAASYVNGVMLNVDGGFNKGLF